MSLNESLDYVVHTISLVTKYGPRNAEGERPFDGIKYQVEIGPLPTAEESYPDTTTIEVSAEEAATLRVGQSVNVQVSLRDATIPANPTV